MDIKGPEDPHSFALWLLRRTELEVHQARDRNWMEYHDFRLADRAAAILQRMTGDVCFVHRWESGYRIVRFDPSGKEVVQE